MDWKSVDLDKITEEYLLLMKALVRQGGGDKFQQYFLQNVEFDEAIPLLYLVFIESIHFRQMNIRAHDIFRAIYCFVESQDVPKRNKKVQQLTNYFETNYSSLLPPSNNKLYDTKELEFTIRFVKDIWFEYGPLNDTVNKGILSWALASYKDSMMAAVVHTLWMRRANHLLTWFLWINNKTLRRRIKKYESIRKQPKQIKSTESDIKRFTIRSVKEIVHSVFPKMDQNRFASEIVTETTPSADTSNTEDISASLHDRISVRNIVPEQNQNQAILRMKRRQIVDPFLFQSDSDS